jgi:hypothetical protein
MMWMGWRNLHNEELHNLYSSPNKIRMMKSRRMRWAGHVVHMKQQQQQEKKKNVDKILLEKPVGRRALGRSRRRLENNIKIDLRERRWGGVHWFHLAQDWICGCFLLTW